MPKLTIALSIVYYDYVVLLPILLIAQLAVVSCQSRLIVNIFCLV